MSHRLDEVIDVCDKITVFKDGIKIMHDETKNLTKQEIITATAGRKVETMEELDYTFQNADILLRVTDLHDEKKVKGVSFELKKGEVLGLTGLVGSGRTETIMTNIGANRIKKESLELR